MLALLDIVVGKKLFAVPLESRYFRLIWTGAVKVFVRISFVASPNTVLKLRNKGAVLGQLFFLVLSFFCPLAVWIQNPKKKKGGEVSGFITKNKPKKRRGQGEDPATQGPLLP